MTESALRRWLVLVHAVLVEERLADEIGALVAELSLDGHREVANILIEAAQKHRIRAMRWRAQATALVR